MLRKAVRMSRRLESLSYVRRLQKCSTCLTKQRLGRDMLILYKHVKGINVKEGEELFKLKNNVGTRANGYKLAMNKNRQSDQPQDEWGSRAAKTTGTDEAYIYKGGRRHEECPHCCY